MSIKPVRIAPSILSADFARLGEEISLVESAGADWIHVDVMDGRFVPNITIGAPVVRSIRKCTRLPIDCHLMIVEPEKFVADFAQAGADAISIQAEATVHLERALQSIRALGKRAGAVINPSTPEDTLRYVLHCLDLVLVMTVNPGFGGQTFIRHVMPKVLALRHMIDDSGYDIDLQVDGGVAPDTIKHARDAGADVFVAGNAVFHTGDYQRAIANLRRAAEGRP